MTPLNKRPVPRYADRAIRWATTVVACETGSVLHLCVLPNIDELLDAIVW